MTKEEGSENQDNRDGTNEVSGSVLGREQVSCVVIYFQSRIDPVGIIKGADLLGSNNLCKVR